MLPFLAIRHVISLYVEMWIEPTTPDLQREVLNTGLSGNSLAVYFRPTLLLRIHC